MIYIFYKVLDLKNLNWQQMMKPLIILIFKHVYQIARLLPTVLAARAGVPDHD